MHSISIILGTGSFRFLFKTPEKVEPFRAFRSDHPTQDLIIDDDFGQHAEFRASAINGIIIEDMDLAQLAGVELTLHNARVHAGATKMAQNDPKLKMIARGPQVLTPFPGNGGMSA